MFSKPVPAHLLPDEVLDLSAGLFVQDNIIEPVRGFPQFHQVREVTARSRERHGNRLALPGVSTRLLDCLPNPFGDASMTLTRLGSRYLQRDREELLIVTSGSAAQHRKDMSGVGHGVDTILGLWIPLVSTILTTVTSDNAENQSGPSAAARRPSVAVAVLTARFRCRSPTRGIATRISPRQNGMRSRVAPWIPRTNSRGTYRRPDATQSSRVPFQSSRQKRPLRSRRSGSRHRDPAIAARRPGAHVRSRTGLRPVGAAGRSPSPIPFPGPSHNHRPALRGSLRTASPEGALR